MCKQKEKMITSKKRTEASGGLTGAGKRINCKRGFRPNLMDFTDSNNDGVNCQ
jgi:hypothetical protein